MIYPLGDLKRIGFLYTQVRDKAVCKPGLRVASFNFVPVVNKSQLEMVLSMIITISLEARPMQ